MDITTVITSGAVAAIATTGLTFAKERHFANKENERKTKMLAIKLAYELEGFAINISKKIAGNHSFDEALFNYQGVGRISSTLPLLQIEISEFDWFDLKNDIISQIMNLCHDHTLAVESIGNAVAFDDEVGLREFMMEASFLGYKAWTLANEIKNEYNIPKLNLTTIFNDPINDDLIPEYEKWVKEFKKGTK